MSLCFLPEIFLISWLPIGFLVALFIRIYGRAKLGWLDWLGIILFGWAGFIFFTTTVLCQIGKPQI